MSGIGVANNFNIKSTKVIDNRCAGPSTETNSITYKAPGLLRYETDNDNWKYYDNTNNWVNFSTGATYTGGEGITINGSNVISIGQSIDETDDVTFNSVTTNSVKGQNNGDLEFKTITNSVETEKLRINNVGAIGIGGGANYGTSNQVLISNGSGSAVSWADQIDTTYTQGTGVTISPSNVINIGQDVGTDDEVTFKSLDLNKDYFGFPITDPFMTFTDSQNGGVKAKIEVVNEPTAGGKMIFYTKRNTASGGALAESFIIKDYGAVEIKADGVGLMIKSEDGTTEQGYIYNSLAGTKDFVIQSAVGSSANKGILFRGFSNADHMRIDNNGNVGIGTNTPSSKLEVNGTATFNNITVNTFEYSSGKLNSNFTVPHNSNTTLPLILHVGDNNWGSNVYTIQNSGVYKITVSVGFASSGADQIYQGYIGLKKGSTTIFSTSLNVSTGNTEDDYQNGSLSFTTMENLNVNDTLSVEMYQLSKGSNSVIVVTGQTRVTIEKIMG